MERETSSLSEQIGPWRIELLAPFEPFFEWSASGGVSDPRIAALATALQHAAALGLPSKGPKDLLKWAGRFGFFAETPSEDLVTGLGLAQSSVLARRDQVWRDWLPVAAQRVPADRLTSILGDRRAARFQVDVASALEAAGRVDALPELVRLSGAGGDELPLIVSRFAHATDDAFAVFCVQAELVPRSPDSATRKLVARRHRALLAAAAQRDGFTEAPAANGDPVAVLAALAVGRAELLAFVEGLSTETLSWLFELVPRLRTRLGEGDEPRPGTPDHELRRRLYAFVMAAPKLALPARLDTQTATSVRNELKTASSDEVAAILGAVEQTRRVELLQRSLDADDQTFDVDRARRVIAWFRAHTATANELSLLKRATSTVGRHLQELALELFLAHAEHFTQFSDALLAPLEEALTRLPPTARDGLVRDLLPAFQAVAQHLAPRLDPAARTQLVRSAGVDAHPYGLRFAELALAAPKSISWAELDVLLPVLEPPDLARVASLFGERLAEVDGSTLDAELAALLRPDRVGLLLGSAPGAVLPVLARRHQRRVGALLRELEEVTAADLQAAAWEALVREAVVTIELLQAFVDAGGVPHPSCTSLAPELAQQLIAHLDERCAALADETERRGDERTVIEEATWQALREGVAAAARESAQLLVGTAWNDKPIRSVGRALIGAAMPPGQGEAVESAGAGSGDVLPFQTALMEAIDGLPEYTEELEAAIELDGRSPGPWTEPQVDALAALMRLLDARGWGSRALPAVEALLAGTFAEPGLREGFRALVASILAGDARGDFVSRLSSHLQLLLVRTAFGDNPEGLNELHVAEGRAAWFSWLTEVLGTEVAHSASEQESVESDAWRGVRDRAEEHRRLLRRAQRAATGLERTRTDVLRAAATELRSTMDEVEVVLRAYARLRRGLTEVGLAPAVKLVELERRQADLDVGEVRLSGQPRELVELLTGGFRQTDGPVLLPASGVPRGEEMEQD